MHAFAGAFKILTCFGFWKPESWASGWQSKCYDLLRLVLLPLPYFLALGQTSLILLKARSVDEMTETLFLVLTTLNACCKATNLLVRRKDVGQLMKMLSWKVAKPMNEAESVIYQDFNDIISYLTKIGIFLVESTTLTGLAIPLVGSGRGNKSRSLPYEMWLPYEYRSSAVLYWLSYLLNSMCALSVGNLSVGIDVTMYGFMLASCAQLELLNHRLNHLDQHNSAAKEQQLLSQSIQHHIFIYNFADKFMETYSLSIISQFIVSSTAISVSVYQFTNDASLTDLSFYMKLLYLCTILTQLFLMCWFGNELALRSEQLASSVFQINLGPLNARTIKSFLLMSVRASRPIVITSGYLLTFSLDSFKSVSIGKHRKRRRRRKHRKHSSKKFYLTIFYSTFFQILKISYSAFNVLRGSE